jgi:hypothetical protein
MKKHVLILATVCIASFSACTSAAKEKTSDTADTKSASAKTNAVEGINGKYQIKSGRYVTKANNNPVGVAMDTYTIVYFSDYGKKELSETVTKVEMGTIKQETHNFSLLLEDMIYNWDAATKRGSKYSIKDILDKNINYETLSDELKKQFKYTELGKETILGKECNKISVEVQPGATAILCHYKGIPMRSEANVMGTKIVTDVTELEENINIPADKFNIPSDVTFLDVQMPGK